MDSITEFAAKYGWILLIAILIIAYFSHRLAERDNNLRIQTELNNKAEKLYQTNKRLYNNSENK